MVEQGQTLGFEFRRRNLLHGVSLVLVTKYVHFIATADRVRGSEHFQLPLKNQEEVEVAVRVLNLHVVMTGARGNQDVDGRCRFSGIAATTR